MTITLGWIRRNKATQELIVASDSRLRSHGAINQSQKIFQLDRGDCCLGFCGDAQVAYPLSVQLGSALNNFIKTRTRGADVTDVVNNVRGVLNNLISSWDISQSDKDEELKETKVLFAGWSWKFSVSISGCSCMSMAPSNFITEGYAYHSRGKKSIDLFCLLAIMKPTTKHLCSLFLNDDMASI
jgi:hypothetical protein